MSADLLESNSVFAEKYWSEILQGLADNYTALGKPDVAAGYYRRVIDHEFQLIEEATADEEDDGQYDYVFDFNEKDKIFRAAAMATTKLISIWYKEENLAQILEELRALDRRDTGFTGTRLAGIVAGKAHDAEFQTCLRALVTNSEVFEFVDGAYRLAIEITDVEEELYRVLDLKYSRGMLAWLCGSSKEIQDGSFAIFTEIITTDVPDDTENGRETRQTRQKAARMLPQALLDRAKEAGPGSTSAEPYVTLLESTAKLTPDVILSENKSTALILGRYHHLAGDEDRAKSVLVDRMTKIFRDWGPDEDSASWGSHLELAHTFTALDDEVNALAAWKLLAPPFSSPQPEGPAAGEVQPDLPEDDQASAGAETDDVSSPTSSDGEDGSSGSASKEGNDTPIENADDSSPEMQGPLRSFCDGCGTKWTYVSDIYCCKDCLDVQLEPNCYAALRAGNLDPKICNKAHNFLYIPPFDEEKWSLLATGDLVTVGDKVMPRKEWLKGIRNQWGIDRDSLERGRYMLSTVRLIERLWKVVRAKRRLNASPETS